MTELHSRCEITVSPQDSDHPSHALLDAIAYAEPGTRILVKPGLYKGNIKLEKEIEIVGIGSPTDIIIESVDEPVFTISSSHTRLSGLTISVSYNETAAEENTCSIEVSGGETSVEHCVIRGNGDVTLGITGSETRSKIKSCEIQGGQVGAVMVCERAAAVLEDCDISRSRRGCVCVERAQIEMIDSKIHGCKDALVFEDGSGKFQDCGIFDLNSCGARIHGESDPVFHRCRIHHCAISGVDVLTGAYVVFNDCVISNTGNVGVRTMICARTRLIGCDIAESTGRGLHTAIGSEVTLEDCSVHNNHGEGMFLDGQSHANVVRSEFNKNDDTGIRIGTQASISIQASNIRQNGGAGIRIEKDSTGDIARCWIKDNRCVGIEVQRGGRATLGKCDLTENQNGSWKRSGWFPRGRIRIVGTSVRHDRRLLSRAASSGDLWEDSANESDKEY